jgi:hypothetical protein
MFVRAYLDLILFNKNYNFHLLREVLELELHKLI